MAHKIGQGFAFALLGLSVLLDAFVIFAGVQMKAMRSWGLCLAAAIVSCIPCYWSCCGLGLLSGIWSIVVLVRPEVKAAFQRNS
jgi:hypothetical protein